MIHSFVESTVNPATKAACNLLCRVVITGILFQVYIYTFWFEFDYRRNQRKDSIHRGEPEQARYHYKIELLGY